MSVALFKRFNEVREKFARIISGTFQVSYQARSLTCIADSQGLRSPLDSPSTHFRQIYIALLRVELHANFTLTF